MNDDELIAKIAEKKEFSQLPEGEVGRVLAQFPSERFSDDERIKKTRDSLRKIYSGFAGRRMLSWNDRSAQDILQKHLSTRERFPHYQDIYARLLQRLPKHVCVIDLGCGVNALSYDYFSQVGHSVEYVGVEAVGQLVDLSATLSSKYISVHHGSLFNLAFLEQLISKAPSPRVLFLFKVIDSLERVERNFTKTLLLALLPLVDRCVISFATESWNRRKKFFVQRTWLIDFLREQCSFIDDFTVGGERYLVVEP